MRAIVIGAGRGSRLMPYTDDRPKCFAEVGGKRIIDWVFEALAVGGFRETVFIGGYRIDQIRAAFPSLTFRHNDDWENNNILASLMYAEEDMGEGFVSTYSDIVFTPPYVKQVLEHPGDIVLGVDTDWRRRYTQRSQHPESDAEKVRADGTNRVLQLSRDITGEAAAGEFVGVAKFSPAGAEALRSHYRRIKAEVALGAWRNANTFPKAYLIDMIQHLIDEGHPVHMAPVPGGYYEIDTTEDYDIARAEWPGVAKAAYSDR